MSGVDSKFSTMSSVDLAVRASSVGVGGVSSVGLEAVSNTRPIPHFAISHVDLKMRVSSVDFEK